MPKAGAITANPGRAAPARLRRAGLLALAAWLVALPAQADVIELQFGPRRLIAEVAATPEMREHGLMQRASLPDNRGMLFVFPNASRQCMWMKDTLIPLSVAFMDAQGRILNIADMQPQSRQIHCSSAPARYALEMSQGWFQRRALQAGDVATGMERLTAR
jgi:uncharacterized membrane protein (UPF0127 family)